MLQFDLGYNILYLMFLIKDGYLYIVVSGSTRECFSLFFIFTDGGKACSVVSFVGRGARLWRHPG